MNNLETVWHDKAALDLNRIEANGTLQRNIPEILIVDDDVTSALMLQTILRKEGFRVISANNGREAREKARAAHPDLILMDINMPEEDGLAACAALKAAPATADIPVIFISAVDDVSSKIEGFNIGGVDYITKPFNPQEVLARTRLHLRLSLTYKALVNLHLEQISSLTRSQQVLLPSPGDLPEARFAACYLPMQKAGGDFYDVIQAGDKIFDYLVADVSGHDLGTALATSALKALIRQNAEMYYTPRENLDLLNRHLRPVLHTDQYATLLYARVNRVRRKLTLLNAGHPPAILVRKNAGLNVIEQNGDLLGIFEKISLDISEINVMEGDRLYIYSDGLIEQNGQKPGSRRAGLDALLTACDSVRGLSIDEAVQQIARQLIPDHDNLVDDVLLLGVEI